MRGAWACALLAVGAAAAGQRAPVLKQVRVPHPYYYREMYLPQVTSGPTSAAWSPDGAELVYSMAGSLWRQALGSTHARQLTDGPGYDHQPDWSPDGRFVAYASYRDDALELWMLDIGSLRAWPLTSGGAVNLEPRFSPDGRRLAFVSTAHEGRFHVFLLELDPEGRPGALTRVTEDRDSGLPRYYYGRHDQYLSPTWSPDGRELLLVSNRGHVWGSGGFVRQRAEPGAAAREVRYEETNWRARPDWSRDGRRVVYASYLGRQWHQLWLMTPEGGDVFPLTYGEWDATAPRFAPDGARIAYVSNEDGAPRLWVIELPGGARRAVEARTRSYLRPRAELRLSLRDARGRPLAARVSVTGQDGRGYAPDDAWRHADDAFDRSQRRFEATYFHARGEARLELPAEELLIEVSRGPEYARLERRVALRPGAREALELRLERLVDLPARGVFSGDVHVHMNYGGAYRHTPGTLALQAEAEDLHVVENLIVNKEQRVPDVERFLPGARPDPGSSPMALIVHGQEFHTSLWGHLGLLGLRDHLLTPFYAAYVNTAAASAFPHNAEVARLARAQGALVGYVHPYDADPDPLDAGRALTHAFPVDVALGLVDYYEALGFVDDYWATQRVWYRLLDCGFRIPAAGGTDAMANYASLRGPLGLNRTYVKSGVLEHGAWLRALKAGRSFATNGPLLDFALDGREPGETLELRAPARVEARVELRSNVPVDHVQIVADGEVLAEVPVHDGGTRASARLPLEVRRSGWYLLRAFASRARHPLFDLHAMATTSPVYVSVAGQPVRSPDDAAFFVAWTERLLAVARAHADWNSEAEKRAALLSLEQARAVFQERAAR